MTPAARTGLALVVLAFPCWSHAPAQTPMPEQSIADRAWFRELLERERTAHQNPALAAAFVIDGKVERRVGSRVPEAAPVRVRRDDAFHLGSLAKPISATMFGVLVDRGILRWDMTMADMFPELVRLMQRQYRRVTVAQLLSHSGGFP